MDKESSSSDLLLWWYPLWMRDIWSYLVYDLHLSLFSEPEARIWYSSSTKLSFWCRNATLDNHFDILTSFAQSEISQRVRTDSPAPWLGFYLHALVSGGTFGYCRLSRTY